MGIGDEIMASGHARSVYEKTGRRVWICGRDGKVRPWQSVWDGLHWIARPNETQFEGGGSIVRIKNGPQARPYIKYPFTRASGMTFSGWRARDYIGSIKLTPEEEHFAAEATKCGDRFVVLEPDVKAGSNPNKVWPRKNWEDLAQLLTAAGFVPVVLGDSARLCGASLIVTPTFRHAVAVLKHAAGLILPDGGLHHAAAALGLPAVVLWGGVNDPEFLGYENHSNLFVPAACGKWLPCPHCAAVWKTITPALVFDTFMEGIDNGR